MERFPVRPKGRDSGLIVHQFAVFEKIQINCTALQMKALHSLGTPGFYIYFLLFRCPVQLTGSDLKTKFRGPLNEATHIKKKFGLFADVAHLSAFSRASLLSLEPCEEPK